MRIFVFDATMKILMETEQKKPNILRKSLADGPSVNLRQFYNSNMTEVQLQH